MTWKHSWCQRFETFWAEPKTEPRTEKIPCKFIKLGDFRFFRFGSVHGSVRFANFWTNIRNLWGKFSVLGSAFFEPLTALLGAPTPEYLQEKYTNGEKAHLIVWKSLIFLNYRRNVEMTHLLSYNSAYKRIKKKERKNNRKIELLNLQNI